MRKERTLRLSIGGNFCGTYGIGNYTKLSITANNNKTSETKHFEFNLMKLKEGQGLNLTMKDSNETPLSKDWGYSFNFK